MNETMGGRHTAVSNVEVVADLRGLEVRIVREMPRPAELFRDWVDLAVIADSPTAPAFAHMFDSAVLGTAGFLGRGQLDDLHSQYAHRARNPIRLFHRPRGDRMGAETITNCCSLLSLGAMDRSLSRKFVFVVPSLAGADRRLADSNVGDYVEAAMYVAGFTRSHAIYFAGFGGGDGSFSNDALVKLAARIYVARHALHLAPLRVYFKYSATASPVWLRHLSDQLALLEDGSADAVVGGHRAVRAA